ncbi:MAG: response regulator [Anaerolineales bacterium]|nr:response regulator [Anaerolineales bacterium]
MTITEDPAKAPRDGTPCVMVVDDEPDFCSVVSELLGISDVRVHQAHDAGEAMSMLKEATPDLILTDVMMPGMDGLAFVRHVRANPCLRSIPTIVVSARVRPEDREAAMLAGADGFLPKPFTWNQLLTTIDPYLHR